jgi:hypothetical protein
MVNLNVCTGGAFGVGSLGELEPANVRPLAWPFSSSPATAAAQMAAANGLRYDQTTGTPGGGLWVPEVGPNASTNRQSGAPASTITSGSATSEASLSNVSFVNTSSVQTLSVMVTLTWAASVTFGATASNCELWGGASLSVGSASVTWDAQDSDNGASWTWRSNAGDSLAFTVAPASTVNVIPRLGIKNVSGGSVTWNNWRLTVTGFSALVDPSTEG